MLSSMKDAITNKPNVEETLSIDEAYFNIINNYKQNVTFYSIPSECKLCYGIPTANLSAESNNTLIVSTKYPLHVYYKNDLEWCHTTYTFKEYGRYGWNLSAENICSDIYVINEPSNAYLPLLSAFMILVAAIVVWTGGKVILKTIKNNWQQAYMNDDMTSLQESESTIQAAIRTTRLSTRIQSIDTFRGIAILLMIFVNNGGGKYMFFNHSAWFGLTVADLVLPWFAWIMGFTITISKRAELRVTSSRTKIISRNFIRSLKLIALGLMINSQHTKYLQDLRFPGVLQLLAITYFFCAMIETVCMKTHPQFGRFSIIGDILENWVQWLIILAIVALHTSLTFFLPIPNCPKGYLGPGGYDHFNKYKNCTAGAAGYIDRYIFGSHIYHKTNNTIYGVISPYDPEGLMNTMSAILIVYLGVHAGKILLHYYQCFLKMLRWLLWSFITGIIAGLLCNFSKEDGVIPLSKNMMTISFVLTTCSFAFLLFSILYYVIDYKQVWKGAPFTYAGANSIFLYVGHSITMNLFPWAWKIVEPTHSTQLAMNLWTTTLWTIIAYGLYKKDIVITI